MRALLASRMSLTSIRELCDRCAAADGPGLKEELFALTCDADDRVGFNALWALTHFPATEREWFDTKRRTLIDSLLATNHTGRRRLTLTLLNDKLSAPAEIRTDYLDYCLGAINSTEPYGVRTLCLKQAFALCRRHPELLAELATTISMMERGTLSPGLLSARNQTLRKISALTRRPSSRKDCPKGRGSQPSAER